MPDLRRSREALGSIIDSFETNPASDPEHAIRAALKRVLPLLGCLCLLSWGCGTFDRSHETREIKNPDGSVTTVLVPRADVVAVVKAVESSGIPIAAAVATLLGVSYTAYLAARAKTHAGTALNAANNRPKTPS